MWPGTRLAVAQEVVFVFDSSPAAGPPGTTIDVSGSKCGSVIQGIEGTVTVSVVSADGRTEIGAGLFETVNTNWQGQVATSPDAAPGTYSVRAHCSTYAEADYAPNTFVVTGGTPSSGAAQASGSSATGVTGGVESSASTTTDTFSSGGVPPAAVAIIALLVGALAVGIAIAWRTRIRRSR